MNAEKLEKAMVDLKKLDPLFCALTEQDILCYNAGDKKFYLGGKALKKDQLQTLVAEAGTFTKSAIWNILLQAIKREACRKLYEESVDELGLIFPKAMLYSLDLLEKKVHNIANLKIE